MKYVLGIVGVVFVILIVILLVFSGGNDRPRQEGDRDAVMSEYAKSGTSVRMTQQGRMVGENERRAIAIHISPGERRLEILSGYEEKIISSRSFANTPAAYEAFLVALGEAGYSKQRESKIEDERAACPLGRRFIYQLKEDGSDVFRTWDTNCRSDNPGTFGGDERLIRKLFEEQIPDYSKEVSTVRLQ